MAAHSYVNTASEAQLNASIDAVTTTVPLSGPSFTGFPVTFPYWGIIEQGATTAEVVEVTNATGSTLTVVRGQGGTSATAHGGGASFKHIVPAIHFSDAETHINATTGVHGVTGSFVGTTGNQTIQDKTYRGKHLTVFSDAQPTGWTAAYEVTADNTSAKDGFVHNNTAADVDRRGFLLTQSGTPRIEGFNDGTLKVTPSGAAVRPGIESTTSIKSATLQVTGASTLQNVTASGTLGVTGASTLSSVSTSGNATVGGTLGVTGATTLSSVSTSGNASVGGTLSVTGTSTHTGVSGFTNGLTTYGSTTPNVSTVATLSAITSPVANQLAYQLSDAVLYRRNNANAAWLPVTPGAEGWFVNRYRNTALQTIASSTDVKLMFPTADFGPSGITASGTGNTDFTFNVTGWWSITACCMLNGSGAAYLYVSSSSSTTSRFVQDNRTNRTGPDTMNVATEYYFSSGSSVSIYVWHNTGSNQDTVVQAIAAPVVTLAWKRP